MCSTSGTAGVHVCGQTEYEPQDNAFQASYTASLQKGTHGSNAQRTFISKLQTLFFIANKCSMYKAPQPPVKGQSVISIIKTYLSVSGCAESGGHVRERKKEVSTVSNRTKQYSTCANLAA